MNFSFLNYQNHRYIRSLLREILSSFITNLTVSDTESISLINTVLSSLIGCPEEISRVTAVNNFRLLRFNINLYLFTVIFKKDSITNKLLQITVWLSVNEEKISFEDSYFASIGILNALGLNLLVILVYIFFLNLFIYLKQKKGFIEFLE